MATPVAQQIPFSDSFENYTNGAIVQALTNNGWDASDPSVVVQTNAVWDGTNAVIVPAGTIVSNAIIGAAVTNVWTECAMLMQPRSDTNGASIDSNAVVAVNLDAISTCLQAYNPSNGWVTLSNTVWGGVAPAVTNGQWARVTTYLNYGTKQCAVFLNGQLVTELLPFINTNANACSSFRMQGDSTTSSYLDDFSIRQTYPSTLTNDWNSDGITDAQEIAAYGYLAFTLNVGPGQTYTTIQSAVTAALPKYTINVAAGTYTENVTLAQSLAGLTGTAFAVNGSLGVGPGAVVFVRGLTSCGNLGISNAASLTVAGAVSANSVTLGSGAVVSVGGVLNAVSLALASGSSLTASGGLSVTGSVSVSSSASLVVNGQLVGQDVSVAGALAFSPGGTLTCTNLSVSNGVTLYLTNVTVTVSNLTIGTGARVVVVNGTVTADGMTLTGSFTLDQNWGNQGASSQLPYSDGFETYPAGTPLNLLGFRGWGASDNGVTVETNQAYGGSTNAVGVGYSMTLSNRVASAGASQVWTDFRGILCCDANDEGATVRSNAAFMMAVTTNGYLSVYNRTALAWDVCTQDVWGKPVASVGTGEWVRISVFNNYATRQCAVFLRGVLVRQRLPFINTNLASYSIFGMGNNEINAAYLDDVYIGAAYPVSLTNDANQNGVPDAQEIAVMGDVFTRGSVFVLR